MAVQAVFIGIDKYYDTAIPELNGARRDATALWALFTDTITGLTSQLLIDDGAILFKVKNAILGTLSNACDDDVVIITYSGHGSPDGNIIMFDTDLGDLPNTAFSMISLAEAFKTSKARVVLLILDCCFSGQAPARVIEMTARPRNPFVFNEIYGEGRILLSACAANESAWEQPGSGHGLLTYSIIEALTSYKGDMVNFPDIAGDIIRLTRIEAERINVSQTPVFLGTVVGGLTFPILKRGDNFFAAFPIKSIIKLSGSLEELYQLGFPAEVADQWIARFPDGLNSLQLEAINNYGVLNGESLLVVAPTSSGKTLIGELAAIQAVISGKKAAFLLPYRALVNEKFEEFSSNYGSIGLRIMRCSGDASDGITPVLGGRYDLGFFTYETFLNLALGSPRLLNQLGLVVLDEGQFITDPNRGIIVELIFSLLLRARVHGIKPQLIVLSAVIGNTNNFDRWLSLKIIISKKRPVPLIEGVLDRSGTFQFIDIDGATKNETMLPSREIVQRRAKPSSQDVIVPLVKKLVSQGEKLLIFRNTRGSTQGCAKYLSNELGIEPAIKVIEILPTQDLTNSSQDLRTCLDGGTAFHNTNLLRTEREAIEKGFRNPNGGIHVLVATTTLAAGINTPASSVILAENEFVGEDGRPFTIAEYKNMAGRAGRLGYNEIGKSIILAETSLERAQLFQKYVLGTPESVKSSFQKQDLSTWTLRLLSQVRRVSKPEIPGLLANTFGGYSASITNPEWISLVETDVFNFVERLLKTGLAECEDDLIYLTLLGRACGSSSLSFESSLRLVELLKQIDLNQTMPIHLLAMIQALDEMDSIYTPIMKRGQSESIRITDASQRYGKIITQSLQKYCQNQYQYWARCKRASILFDWIKGTSIDILEKYYTLNPFQGVVNYGDIIRIADGARFHLRSVHQILNALIPDKPDFLEGLDTILKQLEFGIPSDALLLLQLPISLTRGQYLALYNAGCTKPEHVYDLTEEILSEHVGPVNVMQLHTNFH